MIGMKVRYEITDVNLKISNVTPREAEESYVLIRVADETNAEIVFALSHEQAEHLENELNEANRRWRMHSSSTIRNLENEPDDEYEQNSDHFSH
jgi:hypothetical protein